MPTATDRKDMLAPAQAASPMRAGILSTLAFAMLLLAGSATTAVHAQRAVIIVDGERVEIEFEDDDVDLIRRRLEEQLRRQPVNARQQQLRHMPSFDVSLPTDDELHAVQIDPVLLSIVAELNSDSYETRERATSQLIDSQHENIQLYAVLSRHELTTEQRSRLIQIAQRRLIHAPRGAVGISMRPHVDVRTGATQVEVVDLIDGLPAERVLQLGDRITHLNGDPLESPDQLTVSVQSRRPGEQVTLTILRPKQEGMRRGIRLEGDDYDELTIELTLGPAELLDRASGNRPSNNAVEHLRRQMADAVAERFAPRHTSITIDSDLISANFPDQRKLSTQQIIDRRVEQHPIITEIQSHLRLLEERGVQPPDAVRARWRETEFLLQDQITFAELSDEHRAILEGVLAKFRELVNR